MCLWQQICSGVDLNLTVVDSLDSYDEDSSNRYLVILVMLIAAKTVNYMYIYLSRQNVMLLSG